MCPVQFNKSDSPLGAALRISTPPTISSSWPTQTGRAARSETQQRSGPTTKTDNKSTKKGTSRRTLFECPSSVATHALVARSHTLSVLSTDPETTRRPSGKTATLWTYREDRSQKSRRWTSRRTLCECPVSVATHFPVATSHTLRVLSFDPETTRRPSGNTATHSIYIKDTSPKKKGDTARRTSLECPFSVATHLPVATSHSLRLLSNDAETTCRPSGKTATQQTYDAATSLKCKLWTPRNARSANALSAFSRIFQSPRPKP